MTPENALKWATLFHETYEANAPRFGYETWRNSRRFDPDSNNGKLMLLVCSKVVEVAQAENAALRERAEETRARMTTAFRNVCQEYKDLITFHGGDPKQDATLISAGLVLQDNPSPHLLVNLVAAKMLKDAALACIDVEAESIKLSGLKALCEALAFYKALGEKEKSSRP
jgi:hypothetical protein